MSVGRLCLNLSSSDITWNWLPSVPLYFLPLNTSRKEMVTVNRMKKMNACNVCALCLRRKRRLFCRRGWRITSIATLTLWVLLFVWFFHFFVLDSPSPHLPFFRDSFRQVPCVNLPLVFDGAHEKRVYNSIFRMDLFPLLIFYCISCIIIRQWWMKYQWIPTW